MKIENKLNTAVMVVALAMVLYHLVYSQVLLQSTIAHLNTHLGFCLLLVFLASGAESKGKNWRLWSLVLGLLALLGVGYVQVLWPELQMRAYFNTSIDLAIGVLLILLVLEACRRTFGLVIPLIAVVVILYPFAGHYFPEPFYCTSLGLKQTISNLSIGLCQGIYGAVLPTSANFIFLFIVFGGVLQATGGGRFLLMLAGLAGNRVRGGPGIIAVLGSAGVGSIVGSAAANVAITGTFTIPMMKSAGFKPEQAAGIEAAASNGGQIMPPVMGYVAFAMAGLAGISYLHIIKMAVIPAILYFGAAFLYVYFQAGRLKIGRVKGEEVEIRELLLSTPLFVVPITVIIVLLIMGYSIMYIAFWAIASSILVALVRKKTSLSEFIQGFVNGAKFGAGIGTACACVGLIVATLTMSGLAVKLSAGIETWSGGYLLPALAIIWALCVLLGMGGASLVAYIVVSIFAVPALLKMGVGFEQAHFFTMFVAVFAFLTPPVAIVALIASRLAEASYVKSAIEATKVALGGFLLPFMFIYCPLLLLVPRELPWEIFGLLACVLILLAFEVAFTGYYINDCSLLERILATAAAVSLVVFLLLHSYLWLGVGIALLAIATLSQVKGKTRKLQAER